MTRRELLLTLALVFVLGLLIGRGSLGPSAMAAWLHGGIPDKQGLIHACYAKGSGALRVIDPSGKSCSSSESKLVWHQSQPSPAPALDPSLQGSAWVEKDFILKQGFTCSTGGPCLVASMDVPERPISMDYEWQLPGPGGPAWTSSTGGGTIDAADVGDLNGAEVHTYLQWSNGKMALDLGVGGICHSYGGVGQPCVSTSSVTITVPRDIPIRLEAIYKKTG